MRQIYAKLYVDMIVLGSDEGDGKSVSSYLTNPDFSEAVARFLLNLQLAE
jgi:hypothetical protein